MTFKSHLATMHQPDEVLEPVAPEQQWHSQPDEQEQDEKQQNDSHVVPEHTGTGPGAADDPPAASNRSSPPGTHKRQVTFPEDDALAVVHHLQPSSSAGDLSICQHEPDPPAPSGCWARFKAAVRQLKHDVLALYYAVHDPRTPLLCKLLPWVVLAYALSPLDLIPDFIPVLGLLDDLLLLPLGLWLSYRLIPAQVMADSRSRAATEPLLLHKNWVAATLVFVLWCGGLLALEHFLISSYGSQPLQQWRWLVLLGSGMGAVLVYAVWALFRIEHERSKQQQEAGPLLPRWEVSSSDEE